ncbi:MAG TPA: L-threonylcarbamoyladenylate synthase [Candidatus Paceibacterota bacterium]|nr:L-threonylcarbamoyladenylate synthase [Verrucomicrobiota bacterium]HRY47426.1 L-threonylcarbamoyladenylate synthase [Candidatus Paceibacterota bacterium]
MRDSFTTRLLPTGKPEEFKTAVRAAADLLRRGGIVAIPTETVYGLAANALNPEAVSAVFSAKGRPSHNPVIVHVDSMPMAHRCVREWPVQADALARAFWPGPLTLVMLRSALIPDSVVAGGSTVAVRWPRHRFVQALIEACEFPLAAPSANPSSRTSPTTAEHVWESLAGKIPLIIDGGPTWVGIESTVLDVTIDPPRLLRPGMIHAGALRAVTGKITTGGGPNDPVLRSPGLLEKHYAPRAALLMGSWADATELACRLASCKADKRGIHLLVHTIPPMNPGAYGRLAILPRDPEAFGRLLYAELHRSDALGAQLVVVERPPDSPEWQGILDRLSRAAQGRL